MLIDILELRQNPRNAVAICTSRLKDLAFPEPANP